MVTQLVSGVVALSLPCTEFKRYKSLEYYGIFVEF